MNLSSGTQSLIAGALFDFVAHLTTTAKTIQTGAAEAAEEVYDIREALLQWAHERQLDLEVADIRGWSKFASDTDDLRILAEETKRLGSCIAGALASFAEFATLAESPDLEKVLHKWSTKTGLEIHNPQSRWSSLGA